MLTYGGWVEEKKTQYCLGGEGVGEDKDHLKAKMQSVPKLSTSIVGLSCAVIFTTSEIRVV